MAELVERCDLLLARTVAECEAQFFDDDQGLRHEIDLAEDVAANCVHVVDVTPVVLKAFIARFDPLYVERMDPGEAESLAYVATSSDECLISSSDEIVFRVLAQLRMSERGISLEEVLARVGLGRKLEYQFTKEFRDRCRRRGMQDGMGGTGSKGNDAGR